MAIRRYLRHIQFKFTSQSTNYTIDADPTKEAVHKLSFDLLAELANPYPVGEIKMWNLQQATRNLFKNNAVDVEVLAGYHGSELESVFRGTVRRAETTHQPPDRITTLTLGPKKEFFYEITVAKESPELAYVICEVAFIIMDVRFNRLALQEALQGAKTSQHGFSYGPGPAGGLVSAVINPAGFYWVYRPNNTVQILRQTAVGTGYQSDVLINEASGMVGTPTTSSDEDMREGIKLKTLLDTRVVLDRGLVVVSKEVPESKRWRPISIRHVGDNWDGNFQTEVEGVLLPA